jgi:hypothetical protein
MPELVDSVRVDSNDGRRIQCLFYDDGSYRFRIYETPLYIAEAYLQGGRNDHAIIKVVPVEPVAARHDISQELDAAMREAYEELRDRHGYPANRFLQMLNRHGGQQTAKKLLQRHWSSQSDAVDGFLQLIRIGRVDMSVEAMVLRPHWRDLFSEAERTEAESRLRMTGFADLIPE